MSSCATSPSVRASSPADSIVKKKAPTKKKKTPEEIAEEEQLQCDIEVVVNTFKPEYREYIVCEEEHDAKNLED